ncbi:hypothetical protein BDR26DRAFT_18185 [Obelidium mucronatum]|nr:hypothetical protein BDR26DRAFT_18185 [Obelidium mucronatum]
MPTGATPLRISTTAPVENSSPGAPTPTSSRHATPDSPEGSPQEPSVAIKESQNTISHDDDVDNPFLETTIPQPHEESEEERESTPTPCGGNTVQNQEQMHQHIGLEKMLDTPRPTFPRKSSTPHPQSSRTVNPPPLVGSQSVPRYLGATASSRARQQDTVSTFRGVSPSFNTSRTARPGLKNPPSETIPADTESGAGEHVASDVKQSEVKASGDWNCC